VSLSLPREVTAVASAFILNATPSSPNSDDEVTSEREGAMVSIATKRDPAGLRVYLADVDARLLMIFLCQP
jgi:hypothetical protein